MTLIFRTHAIRRMFERHVSTEDARSVLATGEVIEDYPFDTPYPSRLVLGWRDGRPLHVVAADNAADGETYVIRFTSRTRPCGRRTLGADYEMRDLQKGRH